MKYITIFFLSLFFLYACNRKENMNPSEQGGTKDSAQQEAIILKVLSYNIHRGIPPKSGNKVDLTQVESVIKAQDPDLVALNEVDKNTKRSGYIDIAKELGRLTGMHYFFAKAIDHDGGQYGDAVLSKYPIIDSVRFPLPPDNVSGIEPRDIAMITIKVQGKKILFASTHLDHTGNEKYRILQAHTIVDSILPTLKLPLIIAGDWNSKPENKPISILTTKLTPGCYGQGCPLTFPYDFPNRAFDYIMYIPKHQFTFLSYKALTGKTASDHLPLVAEIKVNK